MVKCWDLEYNKVIRHYHGHLSGVYSCARPPQPFEVPPPPPRRFVSVTSVPLSIGVSITSPIPSGYHFTLLLICSSRVGAIQSLACGTCARKTMCTH